MKVLTKLLVPIIILFSSISEGKIMNTKNLLSPKQQAIIPIAAFTAQGNIEKLTLALNTGLNLGLTVNEINEILIQMYAYAGFPRSLNAINAFIGVYDERLAKDLHTEIGAPANSLPSDEMRLKIGTEVQTRLAGSPVKGRTFEFNPTIDKFLKEHLFADIFARGLLDYKDREIATVSALSSLNGLSDQLRAHINISLNVGLTEEQIKAVAGVLADDVGKIESERVATELATLFKSKSKQQQ